ncbi:unnamed protein product, partial [Prorocentrum cordatum]
ALGHRATPVESSQLARTRPLLLSVPRRRERLLAELAHSEAKDQLADCQLAPSRKERLERSRRQQARLAVAAERGNDGPAPRQNPLDGRVHGFEVGLPPEPDAIDLASTDDLENASHGGRWLLFAWRGRPYPVDRENEGLGLLPRRKSQMAPTSRRRGVERGGPCRASDEEAEEEEEEKDDGLADKQNTCACPRRMVAPSGCRSGRRPTSACARAEHLTDWYLNVTDIREEGGKKEAAQ